MCRPASVTMACGARRTWTWCTLSLSWTTIGWLRKAAMLCSSFPNRIHEGKSLLVVQSLWSHLSTLFAHLFTFLTNQGNEVNSVFAAECQVSVVGVTIQLSSTPRCPKWTKRKSLDQVHHRLWSRRTPQCSSIAMTMAVEWSSQLQAMWVVQWNRGVNAEPQDSRFRIPEDCAVLPLAVTASKKQIHW